MKKRERNSCNETFILALLFCTVSTYTAALSAFHVACITGEKWNFIFSQGYPTGQICAWAFKEQNLSTYMYILTEKIWVLLLEFR